MVRWRFILFLAMLMVTQVRCSKDDEEDYDEPSSTTENDDDEEEASSRPVETSTARVTRTTARPLQCYVCSYKRDSSGLNCLDPSRTNVSTAVCRVPGDKCFMAVETKDSGVSIVVRGCKTDCVSSPDIICCNSDLCNHQPVGRRHLRTMTLNAAAKSLPQTILYFVTVLLLLQAVVRVNIV